MSDITWANIKVRLGELIPWSRNPKTISKNHATRLLALWDKLGQFQSIAIGPQNEVYDGHQRLSVLMAAHGRDYEVDARQSSRALSEKEREELVVAAHVGTVGQFDWEQLSGWDAPELIAWGLDNTALKDWKQDVSALSALLESEKQEVDAEPQIDRAAELNEKWQVKSGDLWQIGEHRLLCGDSTVKADVERVMQGELCGACVTDSPYGINREGIENDDPEGLQGLLEGVLAVMPIENGVIINFQSPRLFPVWLDAIRKAGHKFERALWMHKINDVTNAWHQWMLNGEIIILSSVGKPEWGEVKAVQDCYVITHDIEEKIPHTSVKPLSVFQDITGHTTGIIYEPFCGSGTTMVACENLHRKCRAIEISPNYCAVILERMQTAFPELEIVRIE